MRLATLSVLAGLLGLPRAAQADLTDDIDRAVREALGRLTGGRYDSLESRTRGRGAERGLAISGTGRDPRTLEAHGLDQVQEDRKDPPIPVLALGVTADATDGLYRALGADPYAAETRLRAIREAPRVDARAAAIRNADLAAALADLPARLLDVWTDPGQAPAARRALVFALWDECADDEHGALARAIIESFVRIEAPPASAHAYTEAELRAHDARRESAEPFDPYRRRLDEGRDFRATVPPTRWTTPSGSQSSGAARASSAATAF